MKYFSLYFCSLTLIFSTIFYSFAQTPTPQNYKKTIAGNKNDSIKFDKVKQDITAALTIIQKNHVGSANLNYQDLFTASINSMLHTLDPHSNFLDPQNTEFFNAQLNAQYSGVGMTFSDLFDSKGISIGCYIRATFENSPANRAGLRYGDKIIEVNGISMIDKSIDEIIDHLIGARGSTVNLIVERSGKLEQFKLVRDTIPQPSIPIFYMIRPKVGYIAMTKSFSKTTSDEFTQAMVDLKRKGMENLVLDLRNNGGGYSRQAFLVASTFLPHGQTVFTERRRDNGLEIYKSENDSPDKTSLVVLVNNQTASSAEILSGALQDHDRALFVGENTFGKGLVQKTFSIEKTSTLILTTARYETPSGRVIQRDFSDGSFYDYYQNAGNSNQTSQANKLKKQEYKTDSGRVIYAGGGITPDVILISPTPNINLQNKLNNLFFAFSIELVHGKIKGFENYKIDRPAIFNYDLKVTDFSVTPPLYQAFREFAVGKLKIQTAKIDGEREFIERGLRGELVTAAYGLNIPLRVYNEYDNQIKKAIELLPQAKQAAFKDKYK